MHALLLTDVAFIVSDYLIDIYSTIKFMLRRFYQF